MSDTSGIGDVTLAASSGTSLVLAISDYTTIISLTLTTIGVLAGVLFHVLALMDRRKQLKVNQELLIVAKKTADINEQHKINKGKK